MKSIISSILLFNSAFLALGQTPIENLNYNNTNAVITNSGSFFSDPLVGAGYEVPKGGGVNAIFTAMFWFLAEDSTSQIYTSLGGDPFSGTDVDQGPYSTINSYSDPSYDQPFMVSLCQSDIDSYSLWWECANGITTVGCANTMQPSSAVLSSIYDWPGNGDLSLGQSQNLAPYFDRDGDGIYDPVGAGDYPIIKGCCATYLIQNDAGNPHTNSGTAPIGIEMHYMFYHYGANDLLYHTTFVDMMVVNKGLRTYPKFTHSLYIDGDLGYQNDDFIGSDSLNNMLYFYNADNIDENGYGTNPPALGIVALETQITSATPYQLGAAINQINGFMPSGNAWVHPDGHHTKFSYSGTPGDLAEWNETTAGNQANDRRGIMSTNHGQFNVGDTVRQSYAIIYSRSGTNHNENAANLAALAIEARAFYDSGVDGCDAGGFIGIDEESIEQIVIYPNPSLGKFTISLADAEIRTLEIYDLSGKMIDYSKHDQGDTWRIDLTEKSQGVYLVHIKTDQGQYTKRIIVE